MTVHRILAISIVLMLYATNRGLGAAQAPDFGFRLSVGSCLTERLDTFTGVFTKELGNARTATTHITLTNAQMTAIYRAIEDIGFFDYPSPFNGVRADAPHIGMTEPVVTYHLEVRNGGAVHSVDWKDAYNPTTAEADRFRDLMWMLVGFIHEHPDYKRLPPVTVVCI